MGKQNLILTLLGRKGSGKSTLAREIIADEPRVVILDSMGEYGGAGAEIHWGFESSIRAMLEASKRQKFKLALRVFDSEEMLDLLEMAWELPSTLVVVEETSLMCGPSYLPAQLARLVRFGRHREISQLYIARRPSELPRDLTAQSDLIVTFQHREPRDIDYLRASGFNEREVAGLAPFMVAVAGDLDKAPLAVLERLQQQRLDLTPRPPRASKIASDEERAAPAPAREPDESGDAGE